MLLYFVVMIGELWGGRIQQERTHKSGVFLLITRSPDFLTLCFKSFEMGDEDIRIKNSVR